MIINISITGDKELIAKLDGMPPAVHAALVKKVTALSLKLEAWVKTRKLNGQVLRRVSGRLVRSIFSKVDQSATSVFGRVGSSGDVPYAGIHEHGGKTAAHIILPKKAAVLAFHGNPVGDHGPIMNRIFARQVNHPGSQMPERSYLRSSLRDMSTEISLGMKESVVKAAQQQVKEGR